MPPDAGASDAASADAALDAGEADAGPAPDPITLTDFCTRFADYQFDYDQLCKGAGYWPEAARKASTEDAIANCMKNGPAVKAGRMGYDGVAAARCVVKVVRADCETGHLHESCASVFTPKAALGSECDTDVGLDHAESDCKDGLCEPDATCRNICKKGASVGQKCDAGHPCAPELACDSSNGNVCKALGVEGDACSQLGDCAASFRCRLSTKKCIPLPKVGEFCDDGIPCDGANCVDNTCVVKVAHGQHCSEHSYNCWWPDVCIDPDGWDGNEPYRCDAPLTNGKACGASVECKSGYCENSACADMPKLGEVCNGGRCAAGLYCQESVSTDPHPVCSKQHVAGEPCGDEFRGLAGVPNSSCVDSASCMGDHVCHTLSDVGGACIIDQDDFPSCKYDLWCNLETNKCAAPLDDGAACPDFRACKSSVCTNNKCAAVSCK